MSTFIPKAPYTDAELQRLYPNNLELQLVQVLLRHGERTPVSARFENAGLFPHWPYCRAAERFRAALISSEAEQTQHWTSMQWKRRLESFGEGDRPVRVIGPSSQTEGICQLGELTDKGRQTTHDLGTRLRQLYVDRLQFMPNKLESSNLLYLRATPIPRALESLQQAFIGMYPPSTLSPNFIPPTIYTRTHADETLYPNDGNCRRFGQLAKAFGQRAAERWNDSPEIAYLNKRLGKYMPESSPKVAVDSHPRLSGILDTTYSTLAHGPETKLPKEFYEEKVMAIEDKIVVEEWYAGYKENREYRKLGIGALAGDIVERMVDKVNSTTKAQQRNNSPGGKSDLKFAISGCHDTTLAALLVSFGGFQNEKWPPYTSHIAIELFKKKSTDSQLPSTTSTLGATPIRYNPTTSATSSSPPLAAASLNTGKGWLSSLFSFISSPSPQQSRSVSDSISRKPYNSLTAAQKNSLEPYYVRVRYNDSPMILSSCAKPGNHLEGDESLCTLETFKRVVDSFMPQDWKAECRKNLGKPVFGVDPAVGIADAGAETSIITAQKAGGIEDGF